MLMLACKRGRLSLARYLVSRKANIHVSDARGNTPLSVALAYGHLKVASLLRGTQSVVQAVSPRSSDTVVPLSGGISSADPM
jgi:ankyrin repeat protein